MTRLVSPKGFHIGIRLNLVVVAFVQHLAQVAKGVSTPVVDTVFNPVVILPPKVLVVKGVVGVKLFQVSGQLFGFELAGVDVGMRRRVSAVVGLAVDDRHDVVTQDFEKLFRHIVRAKGILEGQVEFVGRFEHGVAMRSGSVQIVGSTRHVAAFPINIHVDVLGQAFGVGFTLALSVAVGDHPGDCFRLVVFLRFHYDAGSFPIKIDLFRVQRTVSTYWNDSTVNERNVGIESVGHGPIENVDELTHVEKRSQRWRSFLREEDDALTCIAFVWELGHHQLTRREEFVVEHHDDGVVTLDGALGSIVNDFAASVETIVFGERILSLAENEGFYSARAAPQQNGFRDILLAKSAAAVLLNISMGVAFLRRQR